ncbi:3-isopropylmalate dehydratase large subunit [Evansella sp. LMS18]|uniref:3-isopropylmalate dehydratase large subunit n=1 Tax=Evansella sp. LMS18 TaxID=2924033 RepID=UPI0020D1C0BB|nr:3-isopropylmalate dehydratase large subunit [Evansella sp. LMS18]UTR12055.1 3-isopropylmalate dehydratase large subunit [Evansella sp. LMS18]
MGMTLAQKIIASSSDRPSVEVGEIVEVNIDLAMMHDSSGPRRVNPMLEELGVSVWDPEKITVVSDHFVASSDTVEAGILKFTRDWVKEHGIRKFHEREGICHIVPIERGYVRPGMMYVGADSHSTTAGAMGAFAIALGSTDMLGVLVRGKTWVKVPETIKVKWNGTLKPGVMAKDMMLQTIKHTKIDGATYKAVEFSGQGVVNLSIDERIVLSNMAIEMGAKAGMIEPDEVTANYVRARTQEPFQMVEADDDAEYQEFFEFDASSLTPMIALPHSPDNVTTVAEVEGKKLDQAYIGACTGAKYEDLEAAASILKSRQIASGTRLLVAPSSAEVIKRSSQTGVLETLIEAGATLLPTGCGACAGLGNGVLAEGETCISSTNRNFPGRMGKGADVFLASPLTVAASAITGKITDPREFL